MMHASQSVMVGVDGAVRVNDGFRDLSSLLCTAHGHGTRVLVVVLPDLLSDPSQMFYEHLFSNASAVSACSPLGATTRQRRDQHR